LPTSAVADHTRQRLAQRQSTEFGLSCGGINHVLFHVRCIGNLFFKNQQIASREKTFAFSASILFFESEHHSENDRSVFSLNASTVVSKHSIQYIIVAEAVLRGRL
jgi:hypothetical protein